MTCLDFGYLRCSGSPFHQFLVFSLFAMSTIDVKAQQIVIDALACDRKNVQKIILCHTPSKLSAESGMFLSTQDRLQELFASSVDSTIAVFPNANLVRRLCKRLQGDTFSFSIDLVFACHASSDPNDVVLDLLGRFSADFRFIQEVSYLVELPEKTFRKNQPFSAYTVKVTNVLQDTFNLHWYCQTASSYEALIPKVIAEIPDIQELLQDEQGPLTCKSIKRNGCCEISNSGNSFPYVFSSSCFDHLATIEAVNELVSKCRDVAADFPASVIQVKPGVMWTTVDSVEKSVIFLRSLEPSQVLELAQQLTLNRIDFFLPSPKVLVLDLVGVPTASLVRLLHYSEIPISTSIAQGAFSLSFFNCGKSHDGGGSFCGSVQRQYFRVSCGRITALHSVPMQIKWEDIQQVCEPTLEQSNLPKWLKTEFQGSCPKKVLAINEERTVDWYLQFQVPQRLESTFPKQAFFGGKRILVDHVLDISKSNISRLLDQIFLAHRLKKVCLIIGKILSSLAPAQKKNRSNCVVHLEDCFPSLQRVNMLQEISIKSRGLRITGSFEASSMPLLFFNGVPKLEDGLQALVNIASNIPDIATDVDHSVERYLQQPSSLSDVSSHSVILYVLSVQCTDQVPLNIGRIMTRRNGCIVSTTELLRCHAFTECLLFVMLPKGIRIERFCTPKRHFEVVLRVPIRSPKEKSTHEHVSPLTSLGNNPTQHLDQSRADGNGKSTSVDGDSQAGATPSLQRRLPDSVAPPSPAESPDLKCGGVKAPQPVAVDGCGDTTLSSGARGKTAPRGLACAAGIGIRSEFTPSDSPGTNCHLKLTQPVAVDGCGGPVNANGHRDAVLVTPTAVWTEKPEIPSSDPPSQVKEASPQHPGSVGTDTRMLQPLEDSKGQDITEGITAVISTANDPDLKQNGACPLNIKEQPADGKPWVSALSASEILAPIPEIDSCLAGGEAAEISNSTAKPKALPLTISPAARQGTAKANTVSTWWICAWAHGCC